MGRKLALGVAAALALGTAARAGESPTAAELWRRWEAAAPGERPGLAAALLAHEPGHPDLRAHLAWHALEEGRAPEAREAFSALAAEHPGRAEFHRGLALALAAEGRVVAALAVAPGGDGEAALVAQLLVRLGYELREAGQGPDARAAAEHALILEPGYPPARELLAWSLLAEAPERAARLFRELEGETGEPRFREGHRLAQGVGVPAEAGPTATAAAAPGAPPPCPPPEPRGWLEAGAEVRHRAGEPWLTDRRLPVRGRAPLGAALAVQAGVEARRLSAGRLPEHGRSWLQADHGVAPTRAPGTERWTWAPSVELTREDSPRLSLALGTTPLEGPVDATPTGRVAVEGAWWSAELRRAAVEDSLLALVGLRDPYGGKTWGRVVRTGGQVGLRWGFGGGVWASLGGGIDHYGGLGVWENRAWHGDAALGRGFAAGPLTGDLGLFGAAQGFRRHSDFYTFGHGGYFSPQAFWAAGPTLGFATDRCRAWWAELRLSGSYQSWRADGAPKFPLDPSGAPGTDRGARHGGSEEQGLGGTARLQLQTRLGPHAALTAGAGIQASEGYREWQVGVSVGNRK